jgi:hypothetical protein
MNWRDRTVDDLAKMICGDFAADKSFFKYRSSYYLTQFFRDADTDHTHDGTTRARWVAQTMRSVLDEPHPDAKTPPETLSRIIRVLMDPEDATNEGEERGGALALLNVALKREGFEAFYAEDKQCYLRHIGTNTIVGPSLNPHRPLSKAEQDRRQRLTTYLDSASEDEMTEQILMPLFRQLGFHRITAAGHKDKALEFGKDIWMKYTLPSLHVLYFGIQAKRGKIDAAGRSGGGSSNVAEIHNQVTMMLGHEIFDPETSRRVLVDHAFIVAGGEITKAARQWLGEKLDQSKRSQILFMDRNDILNLYVVTNLPLPAAANPPPFAGPDLDDEIPF